MTHSACAKYDWFEVWGGVKVCTFFMLKICHHGYKNNPMLKKTSITNPTWKTNQKAENLPCKPDIDLLRHQFNEQTQSLREEKNTSIEHQLSIAVSTLKQLKPSCPLGFIEVNNVQTQQPLN